VLYKGSAFLLILILLFSARGFGQINTDVDEWKKEAKFHNKNAFTIEGKKFDYRVSIEITADIKDGGLYYGLSTWNMKIISDYWWGDPADEIKEIWLKRKNNEPVKLGSSGPWGDFIAYEDTLRLYNIPFSFMDSIYENKYFEIRFYYNDGTRFSWVSTEKVIKEFNKLFQEIVHTEKELK
jgi:hypothetical protein